MQKKKSHIILLTLFISLLVMNGMVNIPIISQIGKWGKLIIAVLGIFILTTSPFQFRYFIKHNKWIVIFWIICVLFSLLRVSSSGFDFTLFQNTILFIVFIYFYYLLFIAFQNSTKNPDFAFFERLAIILNVNFIFWTLIAIVLRFKIWETVEGRTGLGLFYESYVALGIFSCIGAIANFTVLKYKPKPIKIINFIMLFVLGTMVFLSNSRNSELILVVVILLGVFPFLKKVTTKYIYLIVLLLAFSLIFYFSEEILLNPEIVQFTTGRSTIWSYVYDYYSKNSILTGEGIFGLNSTILNTHIDMNYYFQSIELLYFHNSYLEAFAAAGVIGFIAFIIFLVKSVREKRKYFLINIIISLLLGALFESYLVQPTILDSFLFWYLIIGPINVIFKGNKNIKTSVISNRIEQ